jgi:serine/threonine protein phosphatase 1
LKNFVKKWLGGAENTLAPIAPSIEPDQRVYCVGDIHGRLDLLRDLHRKIETDVHDYEGGQTLVYLGDYIDRGAYSMEVIDELLDAPLPGFDTVYLLGNHEQTLLDFLQHPKAAQGWLSWGGREALLSYGVNFPPDLTRTDVELIRDEFKDRLPERHLAFYQELLLMHRIGDYLFVHAGIRPGVPIQEQSNEDLLWIRADFTESQRQHEHVVVHGHTISEEVAFLPNRIGVDTGAYYSGVLSCLVLEGEEQRLLQTGVGE